MIRVLPRPTASGTVLSGASGYATARLSRPTVRGKETSYPVPDVVGDRPPPKHRLVRVMARARTTYVVEPKRRVRVRAR